MKKSQSQHLLEHKQLQKGINSRNGQAHLNQEQNINKSFEQQDHSYPLLQNNPPNLPQKYKKPEMIKPTKNYKEPKKNNNKYQKISNQQIERERKQPNPSYNQPKPQQIRRQQTVPNLGPQTQYPVQLPPIYYNPYTIVYQPQPLYPTPIFYSPRNSKQLTITINGKNFLSSPKILTTQVWIENAIFLQDIPKMKVKCNKCKFEQLVPSTQSVYKCWKCGDLNNCQPKYGQFICFNCKNLIYFPYKVSNLISCGYCRFVNKIEISDPRQLKINQVRNQETTRKNK